MRDQKEQIGVQQNARGLCIPWRSLEKLRPLPEKRGLYSSIG